MLKGALGNKDQGRRAERAPLPGGRPRLGIKARGLFGQKRAGSASSDMEGEIGAPPLSSVFPLSLPFGRGITLKLMMMMTIARAVGLPPSFLTKSGLLGDMF